VVGLALCLVPLGEEVIVVVPSLLCRGCVVGERSCVLLICICQILDGDSLCERPYVDV